MSAPTQNPGAISGKRKRSGVVVPHEPRWYQRFFAWVLCAGIRAVYATLRFRWNDRSGFFDGPPAGPAIYCLWHNRLSVAGAIRDGYIRKRNRTPGMAAMVSASRDGGFLAAILEYFSMEPVRGSSSRRGPQALLELTTWAERGYDLAITPDGPRGPRYVVQEGAMSLAQLTGLPVIPVSCRMASKVQLKSWDSFQIPLPFSRCEIFFEKPLRVPRDASDSEREALRQQLEQTLRELSGD